MFLIKVKTIKFQNSTILIKNFFKILFFLLIISCSSNDYNTEFPDQNNDEEDENEFAEIDYGLTEYGITYQGIDRDFSIYIPESYTHDSPSAMMFVFHGFGGSNDMIMYYSDFNSISERENFIVVYPQGSSFWGYPHWNVGGWTNTSSADDIGFIDFLIELISQEYNLNQNRMIGDSLSIKNAFVINFGIDFEIITLPNYNNNKVLNDCIVALQDYFLIDKWQINQPIIINPLFVLLDEIDGVQTVKKIEFKNLVGVNKGYSQYAYDMVGATQNGTIFPSLDPSIFEVKFPNNDITGRVVVL